MKHVAPIALLSLGLSLAGCSGSRQETTVTDTQEPEVVAEDTIAVPNLTTDANVDREQLLREKISLIYSKLAQGDLEQTYCSKAYLEVYNAVVEADKNLDEIGFFNSNHWTSSQDGPDNPKFAIKDLNMISPEAAIVTVMEDEMNTGAKLKLIWEQGGWYVDDFISSPDGKDTSEVAQMRAYLKR